MVGRSLVVKPFLIVLGVVLVIASGIAAWMFLYNEKEPVLEEEVITEDSIDSRYGFEPVPEPDPEPESDLAMDAPGNALACPLCVRPTTARRGRGRYH